MANTQTTSKRVLIVTGAILTSLAVASVSFAVDDELCDLEAVVNPVTFPPTGPDNLPNWVTQYNKSTFLLDVRTPLGRNLGAPRAIVTEQDDSVWDKLVHFGETDGITVQMIDPDTGEVMPYHIANPVLVVTLSTNSPSSFAPNPGLGSIWDGYLPVTPFPDVPDADEVVFRPYYVNSEDGSFNNWMAAHKVIGHTSDGFVFAPGTPLDYIRNVLGLRTCLNPNSSPNASASACIIANSSGVTGVGMPFMFAASGTESFDNPYETLPGAVDCVQPAVAQWWKQELFVFVADRDAFIRPSFNPSLRTTTRGLPTDNGRPIWDASNGTYRAPLSNESLYGSYQAATEDFFGFTTMGFGCPQDTDPCAPGSCAKAPTPYFGTAGFEDWLVQWKRNSWTVGGNRPSNEQVAEMATPSGFPFSGLGLTLNWTEFEPEATDFIPGDLRGPFGALSELIHATTKPMFLVKVLNPNQYYAAPLAHEVPWCETCPGDLNRDGAVNATDLGIMLTNWGDLGQCFNLDFSSPSVDAGDLGVLFANWGACPEWPLPDLLPLDCE